MHEPTDVSEFVDRLLAEGLIGMSAAARLYGTFREGRPTHPSTPTRHHLHGWTLPDGTVVRLEAVRVAGRLMTTRAAVTRFLAAQQLPPAGPPAPVGPTPAARRRAADAAAAALAAVGI